MSNLGVVSAPTAVLIRPDGYVAWVGEGTEAGLEEALTRWFGRPEDAARFAPAGPQHRHPCSPELLAVPDRSWAAIHAPEDCMASRRDNAAAKSPPGNIWRPAPGRAAHPRATRPGRFYSSGW